MRKIILLCMVYLGSISIFAQNDKDNERKIYIGLPRSYGEFVLVFVIVENSQIVDSPNFRIKYNKNGLKKIVDKNLTRFINYKFSYTNNGIYIGTNDIECYTTENFNNYLAEKFKANEEASFFTRTSHFNKETYLMACPHFFEMTNEERLQYFLEHVEK